MRERHWQEISKNMGFEVVPDDNFTLEKIIDMHLGDSLEMVQKVAESAAKEYQIEQVKHREAAKRTVGKRATDLVYGIVA